MFGRLRQMLIKEILQVVRDKRTRFVLFIPPLMQMVIFGYAATFEIEHVPIAIVDYDNSQVSRDLIARFTASRYFDVRKRLADRRRIPELIDRGDVTMAIQINSGFARNVRKGQTGELQVIVDSTNSYNHYSLLATIQGLWGLGCLESSCNFSKSQLMYKLF